MEKKFVRDNAILFAGFFIVSLSGFVYHFFSGRALGPAQYSILGSLLSINYLTFTLINVLQLSMSKYTSQLKFEQRVGELRHIAFTFFTWLAKYGVVFAILYFVFIGRIADFLHITKAPLVMLFGIIVFSVSLPVNRGLMQGLQRFSSLSINYVIEGVSKVIALVFFILLGLNVMNALGAMLFSYVVPLIMSFYALRSTYKTRDLKSPKKIEHGFLLFTLISLFSITFFYTSDVLIVKHFFNEIYAGFYAAVSLIGKVVLFGTLPLAFVMYPKINELYLQKKMYKSMFYQTLGLTFVMGASASALFLLFDNFFSNLFFGKGFSEIAPMIGIFGVAMTILSLVNVIVIYFLAKNKYSFLPLLIIFNIIQAVMLWLWHNTLFQIIVMLVALYLVMLIILMIIVLMDK